MKGVIVHVGNPKSIVLFNNGKISAVPTPANCHVGMVVTVKYNSLLKIIFFALGAILLIALGIFIGAMFFNNQADTPANEHWRGGGRGHGHRHMMEQRN